MSSNSSLKRPVHERVYKEIRHALLSGEFDVDQHLGEPELACRLRTSRSPVREALAQLEREKFLVRRSNGRLYVAPLDPDELLQRYVVRAAVEGLATRLAAPRLRTIDLDEMASKIDEMERAVVETDLGRATLAGSEFHDVIHRECGNTPLVEIISQQRVHTNRYRTIVASFEDYDLERIEEHRQILTALFNREADRAEAAMVKHINNAATTLLARIRNNLGKTQSGE